MNSPEGDATSSAAGGDVETGGGGGPARAGGSGSGGLRARAQGARWPELGQALSGVDPDLLRWADDFIFGDVWTRPGMPFEDRMLVAIVALASGGQLDQLRNYLHGALQAGLDPQRIQEALKMLVVYVGFPTAIASLNLYQQVRAKYEPAP